VRPKVEVLTSEDNWEEPDVREDEEEEEFDWYIQQEAPKEEEGGVVLGLSTTKDHGYGFGFAQV